MVVVVSVSSVVVDWAVLGEMLERRRKERERRCGLE